MAANRSLIDLPTPSADAALPLGQKRFPHFWRIFWLTFLVVSLAYACYSFYVPANEIIWADNYASAGRQAVESDTPMILYFSGEWCVACRIMKRQVWADNEVTASVNAQFIPVAIDVGDPENSEVLSRYDVIGAPVTIITDPLGNALRWRVGGLSKSEFLELLAASN